MRCPQAPQVAEDFVTMSIANGKSSPFLFFFSELLRTSPCGGWSPCLQKTTLVIDTLLPLREVDIILPFSFSKLHVPAEIVSSGKVLFAALRRVSKIGMHGGCLPESKRYQSVWTPECPFGTKFFFLHSAGLFGSRGLGLAG